MRAPVVLERAPKISARFEPFRVSPERFDAASLPMMNKTAKKFSSLLDKAKPRWGGFEKSPLNPIMRR